MIPLIPSMSMMPPPSPSVALRQVSDNTVLITRASEVIRFIFLLLMQVIIQPLIRKITSPFSLVEKIRQLPSSFSNFLTNIPQRLMRLPIDLLLFPVTIVLMIIRLIKLVLSPVFKLFYFLFNLTAFFLGMPIKVFNTVYKFK
ncbi:hypothetical protein MTP99_004973 [Tenebrio molitor]|nr:hypothetical protein MTP99_004973 [Tenebrio molitor]CAH1380996.1 unnamed protein product [Tenebrio molitor]